MCQVKNDEVCPHCGKSVTEEDVVLLPDFCDYCVKLHWGPCKSEDLNRGNS